MAENKQYITQVRENGSIMISEDVIATIVAHAVSDVEGVVNLSVKPGADIAELIGKKNWGKGVKVVITDEDELFSIGFYDYLDRRGVCLVEWSENIPFALPERYLRVEIVKLDPENVPDARRITVTLVEENT